jgi:hypothetical protein
MLEMSPLRNAIDSSAVEIALVTRQRGRSRS